MKEGKRKKRWGWILTGCGAVILAAATGFAGGFGSKMADLVGSKDPTLVSYSVSEDPSKCLGGEFVPSPSLPHLLQSESLPDWETIEGQPGAAPLGQDVAMVSVQGESSRTITLTGVEFHVTRHRRPSGAAFSGQCGGPFVGRALEVDLDAHPPQIVDSVATREGMLGSRGLNGERLYRPIRFPWTVSLTDPLLLDVIATTDSCYCEWSAEIPWVSGGKTGTILIDNDGKNYKVTAGGGLTTWVPTVDGWRHYPPVQ